MTNKTEDRFYFGKPGQPERFANISDIEISKRGDEDERNFSAKINGKSVRGVLYKGWSRLGGWGWTANFEGIAKSPGNKMFSSMRDAIAYAAERLKYSRPGQPERFGLEDACWEGYEPVGTKQKDGRTVPNCVPKDKNEQPEEFAAQIVSKRGTKRTEIKRDATGKWAAVLIQSNRTGVPGEGADEQVLDMKWYATEANARSAAAKMLSARPGSPDKFDASSLDRGNFAEASKSPMLGKLLSAKVMPEGGWRAVQVGNDTLVISFEDADLARDFGRRASSKGYNATSPVATTGRYWNVEVKNGK
jgi:hypothetical protein